MATDRMAEISLQTNDQRKRLKLFDISGAGDDYTCRVQITSHGFSCDRPFHFSRSYLERFCIALKAIDCSLEGHAELRHDYEDDTICIKGDGLGHLEISGSIVQHGELEQQLDFGFVTDQTCLRTLIPDIERILNGEHVA